MSSEGSSTSSEDCPQLCGLTPEIVAERLRFFELSAELYAVADLGTGRFTDVSASWESVLGWTRRELLGAPFVAFVHPDDRDRTVQETAALGERGFTVEFCNRYAHKGGGWRWLSWRATCPTSESQAYAIARDVTLEVETQERLRASQELHASLVNTMAEGVVVHRASDGAIIACNPSAERILGLTQDQMMGRTDRDPRWRTVHADLAPYRPEEHPSARTARDGRPIDGAILGVQRPDGELRWLSVSSRPLFSAGAKERPTEVVVSFMDVTDQRRHAHELTARTARTQAILDAVQDAILVVDADGAIESANAASAEVFGWPTHDMVGRRLDELIPDESSLGLGVDRPSSVGWRVRARRRNGASFPAQLHTREALVEGERRYTCVVRDLTHEEELQRSLQRSQRLEALGTLASGVAHEFNNVLQGLSSCLSILQGEAGFSPAALHLLHQAQDLIQRGGGVARQVLSFGQQGDEELEVLDPGGIVQEAVELLSLTLPSRVRLVSRLEETAPVWGNSALIRQVLINLATNAAQAIDGAPGTIELELDEVELAQDLVVSLGLPPARSYVRLVVRDTGPGIAAEHLGRIFEPFFTTKPQGKGTGLGLAVVHGIVRRLMGSITVTSQPGEGATFKLHFPAHVGSLREAAPGQAPGEKRLGRGERVLLVDDDPLLASLFRLLLESSGYRVVVHTDPHAALRELAGGGVDVLATDQRMPGMTGVELIRKARRLQPGLACLLISGCEGEVDAGEGARFLQKPVQNAELLRALGELLQ